MELKLMMEKLGAPQTHLGLKNMIKEVDEDFDGKLSFREVRVAMGTAGNMVVGQREEASGPHSLAVGSPIPSVCLQLWGTAEKQVSFPTPWTASAGALSASISMWQQWYQVLKSSYLPTCLESTYESCCSHPGVLTAPCCSWGWHRFGTSLQSQGAFAGFLQYSGSGLISSAGEGLCSEQPVSWSAEGFSFQFMLGPSTSHSDLPQQALCPCSKE